MNGQPNIDTNLLYCWYSPTISSEHGARGLRMYLQPKPSGSCRSIMKRAGRPIHRCIEPVPNRQRPGDRLAPANKTVKIYCIPSTFQCNREVGSIDEERGAHAAVLMGTM